MASFESDLGFLPNEKLPPQESIMDMCREARKAAYDPSPHAYPLSGMPLSSRPGEPPIAWVKFGANVTIDEALTQDWVAKELNVKAKTNVRVPRVHAFFTKPGSGERLDWTIGYIVMEYIDAPDCTDQDVGLVAQAVQALIGIRGPSSVPGHVGGGPVMHSFFVFDRMSPFLYKSVEELQSHVNGILRLMPYQRRVNLQPVNLVDDASDGLFLSPCDIHPGNFKRLPDDTIVALDFRYTCFVPPSFFALAMAKDPRNFAYAVAQILKYPEPKDLRTLLATSYYLVPFQKNTVGAPKGLHRHGRIY